MKNLFKKWFTTFLLLFTTIFFAQTNGISYQAVIFKPSSKVIPGVGQSSVPLTNTQVCLRFTFIDALGASEYQETVKVTTDNYGIVNTIIGFGNKSGGYAQSFNAISWNTNEKTLLTEFDVSASCSNFEEISKQSLATSPFAFNANTANNVTGIVAIANGGTGATTVLGARTNLGIENLDNTSDLNKPMSIATKTYVDSQLAPGTIVDANATTKGKIQLAGDLSGTAASPTVPGLALKENSSNKSLNVNTDATSDIKFPSVKAVKTYVDTAITGATIVDADATTKGKIQLAGDLSGTAASPTIADNAITTSKVAVNAITDSKINSVSGTKVTGNITGNAANVTGIVGITNGGTGAATAAGARTSLGLGSAATNNTSDFEVPLTFSGPVVRNANTISIPSATATVNGFLNATDFATFSNKIDRSEKAASNGVATLGNDGKIPSNQIPPISFQSANVVTSQATMLAITGAQVGSIAIRTDVNKNYVLSALPATTLSNWLELSTPTSVSSVNGNAGPNVVLTKSDLVLGNVDNTSDLNKPISSATQSALDLKANGADVTTSLALKENTANKTLDITTDAASDVKFPSVKAVKTYVDTAITGATIVDADATTKGKIQLAGDLSGTAASPTIADNAITSSKVAVNAITDSKINNVSGTKVTGNITGNAANVTGIVGITNGGTGAATAAGARTNLGLGSAATNNTSDFEVPLTFSGPVVRNANTISIPSATATVNGYLNATDFATFSNKIDRSEKAASNGVATLGNDGKIPSNQIPPISFQSANVVTSQAEMLTITGAQVGSIAIRTDVNKNYVLSALPATTLSNWLELSTPTSVSSVNGYPGPNVVLTKSDLVLGNVDNTSDLNKPISSATQSALDLKANGADVTTSLALKENTANKTLDITADGTSDVKFPSAKAVKTYVDSSVTSGAPDATPTTKGKIQLAGDLSGSAASPTIATGAVSEAKLADTAVTTAKLANSAVSNAKLDKGNIPLSGFGAAAAAVDLGSHKLVNVTEPTAAQDAATKNYVDAKVVDGITDAVTTSAPTQNAVYDGLALKENTANKSTATDLGNSAPSDVLFPTQKAVKAYVDSSVTSGAPDATPTTKGKIQLAGDLSGSAASPTIANSAVTNTKLDKGNIPLSGFGAAAAAVNLGSNKLVNVTDPTDAQDAATKNYVDTATAATTTTLATKEDKANKSTTTTLGTSDVLYPTQNAVKTYADAKVLDVITDAVVTSAPTQNAVYDGLALKENTANKSTATDLGNSAPSDVLFPTQKAVKAYVDSSVTSGAPDATPTTKGKIQLAGDLSGSAASPTIANEAVTTVKLANSAVTNTKLDKANIPLSGFGAAAAAVDLGSHKLVNVTDPTAAQDAATKNYVDTATAATTTSLATKEDKANKSTTTTLGTSDVLYPTQNAVKTYADAKVLDVITDAVTTSAPTQNAVYDGLALKENTANKSTATDLGNSAPSDVLFPTQKAVKAYVDSSVTSGAPDATPTTKGKIQLAGDLSGSAASPTIANSAVTNTKLDKGNIPLSGFGAAAAAVDLGSHKLVNVTDPTDAQDAATKNYVDAATTSTTTTLATKEDKANKSTTTTLGTSDVLYPTQNAVKTYADAKVVDGITDAVTTSAPTQNAVYDGLALKENTANKSTATDLGNSAPSDVLFPTQKAVKAYVDSSVTSGAPDATPTTKGKIQLAGDLSGSAASPTIANSAVTNTKLDKGNIPLSGFGAAAAAVDLGSHKLVNVTDPTDAQDAATKNYVDAATTSTTTTLATKEDKANKSTTTTLGTSDVLYPTQNAVKTYVDAKVVDGITDAVTTSAPTQNAVYDGLALKENAANKSTATTLGTSDVLFPTQKAVKTYVDTAIAGGTIVDADATTKGKIQLAGDLTGTAAIPVVAAGAIGTTKLAANAVTIAKLPTGATATTYLRGDGTWVNPSADPPLATISASTSLDATYAVVRVNTSGGNVTITLPAANTATNRSYTIIKIDSSNNSLIFNLPIYYDISSTFTQANVQGTYVIKSNGTNWYLVN